MTPIEVKDLRSRVGLTQSEFARRLKVSPVTVSRWERGESSPLPVFERGMSLMSAEPDHGGDNGQKEG